MKLDLKRTDFNVKKTISVFETTLDIPELNNAIINIIDSVGDVQNNGTNVKGQMTEWNMLRYSEFNTLGEIFKNVVVNISQVAYDYPFNPAIDQIWGIKYKSEDETLEHNHFPSHFACVYYVSVPENAPGLYFPEANIERAVKTGSLIFFEGSTLHSVKKRQFNGFRYAVAANISHVNL